MKKEKYVELIEGKTYVVSTRFHNGIFKIEKIKRLEYGEEFIISITPTAGGVLKNDTREFFSGSCFHEGCSLFN